MVRSIWWSVSVAALVLALAGMPTLAVAQIRAPAPNREPTPQPQPRREPQPQPRREPPPQQPDQQQSGARATYQGRFVWPYEARFHLGARQFKKLTGDEPAVSRTYVGGALGGNYNKTRWIGFGVMIDGSWGQELQASPIDDRLETKSLGVSVQLWFKFWRLRPEISGGIGWLITGKKVFPGDLKTNEKGEALAPGEEPEAEDSVSYSTGRVALGFQPVKKWPMEIRAFVETYTIDSVFEQISGYDRELVGYGISIGWMEAWSTQRHRVQQSQTVTPTK